MEHSTIRPVTRYLPSSKELWDDTNLPLCVVVTPGAKPSEEPANPSEESTMVLPSSSRPLSSILKCLQCGAPHPTKATHFRPMHHSVLLCYLCGKTSSTAFADQQEGREEEQLDEETFDQQSIVGAVVGNNEVLEQTFQVPLYPDIWSAPAMTCPPVWWIVLDASQTQRKEYWTSVASVLETAMAEIPPHVHVGMLAASSTTVSSWDLTTPIPHVCHYPYTSTNVDLCLVPADALHYTCIQSALRAVADAHASGTCGGDPTGGDAVDPLGMALGLTIELILEYMDEAKHPGDGNPQDPEDDAAEDGAEAVSSSGPALKYAGGKILCFLGNPPLELETKPVESQPYYFQGGVAGACSGVGSDKWQDSVIAETEPTDMTPKNLKKYTAPMKPEDIFDAIGTRCANAALGVDLIVVVPEDDEESKDEDLARLAMRPWYGLPLLRTLSDTSGAPGPLILGSQNLDVLEKQVLSRTPWQPGMIFGTELRLRISPGFELEDSPIDPVGRAKLQLGPFLSSGGIAGPAVTAEPELWVMGSCDPHTSLTLDLEVQKQIPDSFNVDGYGEVEAKPVIQTCVAYTCVEEGPDGEYETVCKMKISCLPMPLVDDVEPIFDEMDTEAMATVLFHKLSLSAIQEGLAAAQETGESWLRSLLICVYQSAVVEQAKIEELMDQQGAAAGMETTFVGSDRLLDQDGTLEIEDVLMGKGHSKIAVMPLMLYGLLQCDALRPTSGSFRPSMDARCAAISQMASMTPSTLAKCIAPAVQLWSTKDGTQILESVELAKKAVLDSIEGTKMGDAVFFLDSPQQILVFRADRLYPKKDNVEPGKSGEMKVEALKATIEAASKAYRTPPTVRYELKGAVSKEAEEEASTCFDNTLLEDKATASGNPDFAEWKESIASLVQEDLEKSGDIL